MLHGTCQYDSHLGKEHPSLALTHFSLLSPGFPLNVELFSGPNCMSLHYLDTAYAPIWESLPSPHPATNISGRRWRGEWGISNTFFPKHTVCGEQCPGASPLASYLNKVKLRELSKAVTLFLLHFLISLSSLPLVNTDHPFTRKDSERFLPTEAVGCKVYHG